MNSLEKFVTYLTGEFDNSRQIEEEKSIGKVIHPKAKHVSYICNDKIENLPKNFKGYFIIEESYYEFGNIKNSLPHLFMFSEKENGNILLESYEIPKRYSRDEFRNDNNNIKIDFNELKKSIKFIPLEYKFINDGFEGESTSKFSETTTFTLKERTEKDTLIVSEVMKNNGKITFGFENPIIYKRIK